MFLTRVLSLLTLAGFAYAHFKLTYPPTRGFIAAQEVEEPCGGFNNLTNRTSFPIGNTFITLHNGHPVANVLVMLSFAENPKDITNFTISNGSPRPPIRDWFQITQAETCIGVNIQSLGYSEAHDGVNATLLVEYSAGDGSLWQCADITLSSSATIPSNVTCSNEYSTTAAGPTATSHNGAGKIWASSGVALLTAFVVSVLLG